MPIKPLELFSEPFGSTGNIGDNIRRLLGAPTLDPLQTVIRESLQNIADAAKLGIGPEIEIRIRRLTESQRLTLESKVLMSLPAAEQSRTALRNSLSQKELIVMEICDFRTIGLGGPTRSDRIPLGTEDTQFINFLRNIGAARNTVQGGGTYGFGKIALYRASCCSTIIVDTLPHAAGMEGRRIIGCHVGPSFEIPDNSMSQHFTGRHWWGIPDPEDGIVDPLTGADAQALALALGLPDRRPDQTGTSIMILDFMMDGEDLQTVGNKVIGAVLWNFWPRMMRDTPASHKFDLRFELDGVEIKIPAPEDFPPLDLFSKAMRAARSGKGNDVRSLSATKSQIKVGTLAIEKGLRTSRRLLVEDEDSLFPTVSQHIALMRPVELVVKYLLGTALPDERLEWAGVFITSDEEYVESAFAESEPPAHDDWIPENLPKGIPKTLVNVALRDLRAHAADMGLSSPGGTPRPRSGPPLAKLAGRMGSALEGVNGDGAGRKRGNTSGGRVTLARARASAPNFIRLEATEGETVAVFITEVRQNSTRSGSILTATAAVAVDGGRSIESDVALPTAKVLSICSSDGIQFSEGGELTINGADGLYEIRVQIPSDCAVIADADVLTESNR
ncbi:hypothetical protein PMI34_04365 [Pseudomonas sp. GM74]|uniref:hypothetical protein n=1 Tax=Pseudomonas sp. GM74 TaxID=1144336 RepID=UPI0002709C35|nr:hypothetical protein [Pseudomonas sp. GM74]EJM85114.1 hypothetical protein PMI34_04365 [Pseudomonas sp. GM74]